MTISLNTNAVAFTARVNLANSSDNLSGVIERLSTGLRINTAADDAAGLAISTRMSAQVDGTQQAARNAQDAIGLAQTADAALAQYSDILLEIRELAVQSANGTNSDSDKESLQAEVEQLVEELGQISRVQFAGVGLFDGSVEEFNFQTGANVGDTVSVAITSVQTDEIGAADTAGVSAIISSVGSAITLNAIESDSVGKALNQGDILINSVSIGPSSGDDDTASYRFSSSSAIAKVAAINRESGTTGVTASVEANVVQGIELSAAAAVANETLTINGTAFTVGMLGNNLEEDLNGVADTINANKDLSGVAAEVVRVDGDSFRIDLVAEDGRNITVGVTGTDRASNFGINGNNQVGEATFLGSYTLISEDGSDITVGTSTGAIDNAGLNAGTYTGGLANVVGYSQHLSGGATNALAVGDITVNGVAIDATTSDSDTASYYAKTSSAIAIADAINQKTDSTGVTAEVNANEITATISGTTAGGAYSFNLNGVAISGTATASENATTLADLETAINAASLQSGVTAEVNGNNLTFSAEDGRNITFTSVAGASSSMTLAIQNPANITDTSFYSSVMDGATAAAGDTFVGSFTLTSGDAIDVGTVTASGIDALLKVGEYGSADDGQLISQVDISTVEGAEKAITAVDNALDTIAGIRGQFGAVSNRFEATISNLNAFVEATSSALSAILDADYAFETGQLTKYQTMQQAGVAALAQANSQPQIALSLLQ